MINCREPDSRVVDLPSKLQHSGLSVFLLQKAFHPGDLLMHLPREITTNRQRREQSRAWCVMSVTLRSQCSASCLPWACRACTASMASSLYCVQTCRHLMRQILWVMCNSLTSLVSVAKNGDECSMCLRISSETQQADS